MTNTSDAAKEFATGTWRAARTLRTVPTDPTPDLMGLLRDAQRAQTEGTLTALLHAVEDHLADQEQKRRLGARIKQLREDSPYNQEAMADGIGVTLRAYQKMEATGGVKFGNLAKIASMHNLTVADLYERPQRAEDRLARVERRLDLLLATMASTDEQLSAELELLLEVEADAQDDTSADSSEEGPAAAGGQR